MSREAVKKVAFLGKAPNNRSDLHRILQLADRLIDHRHGESRLLPSNVIPFPGSIDPERNILGNSTRPAHL